MSPELASRTQEFLALHRRGNPLVLPNAWDVASARIFERLGAEAIGTTSMGIAASAGLGEGGNTPWALMRDAIENITRAVDVPVTADIEMGYSPVPGEVADYVVELIELGVVGFNIEDSSGGPGSPLDATEVLEEKIRAVRNRCDALDVHPVINAKTDVFLLHEGSVRERLERAMTRAGRYVAAGADCVFVPGGLDKESLEVLVNGIEAPLNVVANPAIGSNLPSVSELASLGVARISVGSSLMRATLSFTQRMAREILNDGVYNLATEELNRRDAADAYHIAVGEL